MKKIIYIVLSLFIFIGTIGCKSKKQQITKDDAIELLDKYYESLRCDDFDMYCTCFPQFYIDKMYEEIEELDNDFWTKIQDSFNDTYGEDFEIDYEFVKMQIISDEGLEDAKRAMASAFRIGKPNLTAAYLITYNETISGNSKNDVYENLTIVIVKIDDVVYLYDTSYEVNADDYIQ